MNYLINGNNQSQKCIVIITYIYITIKSIYGYYKLAREY